MCIRDSPCAQALAKQHAPAACVVSVARAKLLPAALYGAPVAAAAARAPMSRLRSEIAKVLAPTVAPNRSAD
eukprot:9988828-Alexandrium_andersonii.AAC.1